MRCFAVFAVLLGHYAPKATAPLPLADLGVRLFFVLSGFLITGILLECRLLIQRGASPAGVIGRFYVRRFLRLTPAFYVLLGVMWWAAIPEVRDSLPWHLTYTTNIYLARLGQWHGATSHLWSIAVEEQFYLLWPAIVLFHPQRRTNWLLYLVLVSAPAFRLIGLFSGWSPVTVQVLPFGAADSLALGALLASAWSMSDPMWRARLTAMGRWATPVAVLLTALNPSRTTLVGILCATVVDTAWSLSFMWLIDRAAVGYHGMARPVLEHSALLYLGRISYGIYLFHLISPNVVRWLWSFGESARTYPPNGFVGVGAPMAVSVVLATISWFCCEKPINELKRLVPY